MTAGTDWFTCGTKFQDELQLPFGLDDGPGAPGRADLWNPLLFLLTADLQIIRFLIARPPLGPLVGAVCTRMLTRCLRLASSPYYPLLLYND